MRVVRRGVEGIDLERLSTDVGHIVPGPCRNHDCIAVIKSLSKRQGILLCAHLSQRKAALNADKLVCIGVNFQSDFPAHRDAHEGQLQVFPRPERRAVVVVQLGQSVNVERIGFRAMVAECFVLGIHGAFLLY